MTLCWQGLVLTLTYFNSHPHKEDDGYEGLEGKDIKKKFQLTSSQGGWLRELRWNWQEQSFQLTSSQGGWQLQRPLLPSYTHFNSHPHKEDDLVMAKHQFSLFISTHILTRRMTMVILGKSKKKLHISTHILTRRMTFLFFFFLDAFIFQLTSSQGGWRGSTTPQYPVLNISTHILTRRMTRFDNSSISCLEYFNSHPHKEDDAVSTDTIKKPDISTHILTRRMTNTESRPCPGQMHFNSHPHKEDDTIRAWGDHITSFQLTSSQGGWHWGSPGGAGVRNFNSHPHKEDDSSMGQADSQDHHFNSHPHKEDDSNFKQK